MHEIIVDASIAVKWLVQEDYSEAAKQLLSRDTASRIRLIAPNVIVAEIGHALRRLVNRGEMQVVQAEALYDAFIRNNPMRLFPLEWQASSAQTLAQAAMRLGNLHICSFYDALYIALTTERQGTLVTADRRLYEKPLPLQPKQEIVWIGDLEEWLRNL